MFSSLLLPSQGGNNPSMGKTHSSAASKLKHLQQNSTEKTKSGKKEDVMKTQSQQQVSLISSASLGIVWRYSDCVKKNFVTPPVQTR